MTPRLLTQPCLACMRETGMQMCELCNDLEDAEERAAEHTADERITADERD